MITDIHLKPVKIMSHVAPEIKNQFDTLSTDLKNIILERNVKLNTMQDLIRVLEDIVKEGETNHV